MKDKWLDIRNWVRLTTNNDHEIEIDREKAICRQLNFNCEIVQAIWDCYYKN